MESHSNPYAVSATWDEIQDAPIPHETEMPKVRLDSLMLFLILATCVIGSVVSTFRIYSIIPSGIVLAICGFLLIGREMTARRKRTKWPTGMFFGLLAPLFSLSVFALIFFNEWGPDETKTKGVPTLCIFFAVAMCAFSIPVYRELRTLRLFSHESPGYGPDEPLEEGPSAIDS